MKTASIIFLLFTLTTTSYSEPDAGKSKPSLELIASKQDKYYSYQLYQAPISGHRWNLVLQIKNTGAKYMNMSGDRKPFISLKDSKGKKLDIVEVSESIGIAYQSFGIIQISALPPKDSKSSYTLEVKGPSDTLDYLKIVIPGIKPPEKQQAQQVVAPDG